MIFNIAKKNLYRVYEKYGIETLILYWKFKYMIEFIYNFHLLSDNYAEVEKYFIFI